MMHKENPNEMYEKYSETVFNQVNILTIEQFEKASVQFDALYGEILPDESSNILDLGCGSGHFLYYLKKKGYTKFKGIDISPQQVEYCRKNITENVEEADGFEYLSGFEGAYDVIAAHDILEHVPKERVILLLKLVCSSLKDEGFFIARVPNMSNPLSLSSRYGDFTHEVAFTEKSLHQVLMSAGFNDIKVLPSGVIQIKSVKNVIRKIFVGVLHGFIRCCYYIQDFTVPKHLDKNLVVIARKK